MEIVCENSEVKITVEFKRLPDEKDSSMMGMARKLLEIPIKKFMLNLSGAVNMGKLAGVALESLAEKIGDSDREMIRIIDSIEKGKTEEEVVMEFIENHRNPFENAIDGLDLSDL